MTREEAITVLERLSDNTLLGYQHKAALNIAIHDIKQRHDWDINNLILINKDNYEPLGQELCENAISRQAVLDKIKEVCFSREKEWVDFRVSYGSNGQRDFIVNFIESLPSIQPKPKTGHWIPVNKMLPEPRIDVWCNSDMGQMVGYYDEYVETWYGRDYLELMVTAWMPLPEPYKPQESEDKE